MQPLSRPLTADHVAILRRLRGLPQAALAARLGVRQPLLSEIERGRRPVPADFEQKLWKALAE